MRLSYMRLYIMYFRTQSRGRTGTTLLLLVFETSASTNSAIWAFGWSDKDRKNLRVANCYNADSTRKVVRWFLHDPSCGE
jgi:hypothetical protein